MQSSTSSSGPSSLVDFVGLFNTSPFSRLPTSPFSFPSPPQTAKSASPHSSAAAGTPLNPINPPRKKKNVDGKTSRARTGCITCRLRKKRCDEAKPDCETCSRLGIQCMGYGKKRPEWLKDEKNLKRMRDEIREKVIAQRATRPRKRRRTSKGKVEASEESEEDEEGDDEEEEGDEENTAQNALDNGQQVGQAQVESFESLVQLGTDSTWTNGAIDPFATGINPFDTDLSTTTADSNNIPVLPPEMWGINTLLPSLPTSNTTINATTNEVPFFPDLTLPMGDTTGSPPIPDNEQLEEMWKMLFSSQPPSQQPSPTILSPDPFPPLPETNVFTSVPDTALTNMGYIHHYLNVVLPLQFRTERLIQIGALVAPLAFQNAEVLTSMTSLAALHLASQRNGTMGTVMDVPTDTSPLAAFFPTNPAGDTDAIIARTAHRDVIDRLRFISSENLASDDVIVPALFAVSYYLFMGGTSSQWREVIAIVQKCLFAALAASPDLTGEYSTYGGTGKSTPWQKYRALIEVMIGTDIIGSISLNRGTRLLPTYRTLLTRMNGFSAPEQYIPMLDVMGCDNTTLLAIAETTALSEWRDRAEETGSLSQRSLVKRGDAIEKLLSERTWRNSHTSTITASIEELEGTSNATPDEWTKTHLMAEVFYHAAKVYLATVVNGPFPKVPEIAAAVQEAIVALKKIADRYPRPDIYRKLVFPITVTGAHCDTPQQQEFFRECFRKLGPEASFGNTKSALMLMEEVWRKRKVYHPQVKVCWRQTMVELGWEAGLLLI